MTRLAVDVGGTFTDCARRRRRRGHDREGPDDSDARRAILAVAPRSWRRRPALGGPRSGRPRHDPRGQHADPGTGAGVGLVTTAGFIAAWPSARKKTVRPLRPVLPPPEPLVPRRSRSLSERTAATARGCALGPAEVEPIATTLRAAGIEAVAVCLLHSFATRSASRGGRASRAPAAGVPITLSSEIAPDPRDHRASTAVANAYVAADGRAIPRAPATGLRGAASRSRWC